MTAANECTIISCGCWVEISDYQKNRAGGVFLKGGETINSKYKNKENGNIEFLCRITDKENKKILILAMHETQVKNQNRHSVMYLDGEVVQGRTVNGSKDEISRKGYQFLKSVARLI